MLTAVETSPKAPPETPIDGLLNLKQASRALNVSQSFLRREVRLKRVTAVKLGRRLLFEPATLQEFIASHRTQQLARSCPKDARV
ncbi:MAG: helix-turn-helix domain-containing protein [Acidobacteriota bacterium]|nr:helix-turn-helix domain-containing protein [Acidobacteriota bacterium]